MILNYKPTVYLLLIHLPDLIKRLHKRFSPTARTTHLHAPETTVDPAQHIFSDSTIASDVQFSEPWATIRWEWSTTPHSTEASNRTSSLLVVTSIIRQSAGTQSPENNCITSPTTNPSLSIKNRLPLRTTEVLSDCEEK
jgi:hypothetical protein